MTRFRSAPVFFAAFHAALARAELADDVDELKAAWSHDGHVTVLSPRFPVPGEMTLLALPPDAVAPGDGCTTVAVLGATSTTFALRLGGDDAALPQTESFLPSVAGAVHLVKCGADRAHLDLVGFQMRSPHGVLETLVVTSKRPPIELRAVLPHRDPGAVQSPPGAGPPPAPAPLETRIAAVERSFSAENAVETSRRLAPTDATGAGQILLDLAPGCHRISVLAVAPEGADVPVDVDAELAWANGTVDASDRTDSPDAALLTCTGERRLGVLAYGGSAPKIPVLVVHGRSDLPKGLPPGVGPGALARMARALAERHVSLPNAQPAYASLGVTGLTELPIEVEPGECYVAMTVPIQGDAKLLTLGWEAAMQRTRVHSDDGNAAMASFCAGASERAKLEVEVHGREVVWLTALWPVASRRLGEDAP